MKTVVTFPASDTMTPEQALASAAQHRLRDVLVVGYDQNGDLVIPSSRMSRMDALWLAKMAEQYALGKENQD